jgi:hypothetical protein
LCRLIILYIIWESHPENVDAIEAIITTLVLCGLVVSGGAFVWVRRRRIVATIDDVTIGAAAKTVKGYRQFKRRVEDRARQIGEG